MVTTVRIIVAETEQQARETNAVVNHGAPVDDNDAVVEKLTSLNQLPVLHSDWHEGSPYWGDLQPPENFEYIDVQMIIDQPELLDF